ncbi:DUF2634 domain-containing protein [Loigolactobacillus bifermentans]|uniref:DUF2634 domain-containing protein n=1 Tax=Loigolactobacillus bifermentans DSM 20003 TaxID=1423726 RepID=A0A0R1H2K6_9LACO|nr:DUF2634 domain-containing protein [Loigolactobacillus bifermentans]KRK40790.1 hypothetical protein FC07_GL002539 [Loigolactobacillus bifermentans DSM 20003]
MIDLKLDSSGDLAIEDADIAVVSDVEEVKQNIALTLRTRKGEFFADAEMGLDWDYLIGDSYKELYAAGAITDALLEDPRVTAVGEVNLELDHLSRHLNATISFTIDKTIQTGMEVAIGA